MHLSFKFSRQFCIRTLRPTRPRSETLLHATSKKCSHPLYTPRGHKGAEEVQFYSFSTSAPDGGEWSASRSGRFTTREKSPRCPLNRTLTAPESWYGCFGKKVSCPCQDSKSHFIQRVAQLRYFGSPIPQCSFLILISSRNIKWNIHEYYYKTWKYDAVCTETPSSRSRTNTWDLRNSLSDATGASGEYSAKSKQWARLT